RHRPPEQKAAAAPQADGRNLDGETVNVPFEKSGTFARLRQRLDRRVWFHEWVLPRRCGLAAGSVLPLKARTITRSRARQAVNLFTSKRRLLHEFFILRSSRT